MLICDPEGHLRKNQLLFEETFDGKCHHLGYSPDSLEVFKGRAQIKNIKVVKKILYIFEYDGYVCVTNF